MNTSNNIITCAWCNQPSVIIWVHGHGQCSVCGINIDECCRGESCSPHQDKKTNNSSNQNSDE